MQASFFHSARNAARGARSRRFRAVISDSIHFRSRIPLTRTLSNQIVAQLKMGGKHWQAWNPEMKKTLLELQEKKGADDGSWAPSQGYGMCACVGRTMSTALGAMTLEVYYRYLRIYE